MSYFSAFIVYTFLFIGILSFVESVSAARSISITGNKTTLGGDEEIQLTASASGFTDGEAIFIKGAFFQAGSSNYFGFTKSGDNWIKNSASNTSQRAVKIGDWDGNLSAKSDFSDSGFKGEGDYMVKLGFYWGSYASVNWSVNSLPLFINEPDPTPTQTPTPTDTPVPTPTPPPPVTATNTPSPTPTATHKPTLTDTPLMESTPGEEYVLGSKTSAAASASAFPYRRGAISLALIGAGLGILSIASIIKK